jgi:hypothetical protein
MGLTQVAIVGIECWRYVMVLEASSERSEQRAWRLVLVVVAIFILWGKYSGISKDKYYHPEIGRRNRSVMKAERNLASSIFMPLLFAIINFIWVEGQLKSIVGYKLSGFSISARER